MHIFSKFKYNVPHIFYLLFLNIFLSSNIFYNIKKWCTMHIFSKFKYNVPHIFYLLFLNIFLSSNIFYNIKKYDVPCIYLNISSVSQFKYFSKFKCDVPHISIYFLSPISEFRENITYFYSKTNKSTKYSIQII
jgi:hypothetical protein